MRKLLFLFALAITTPAAAADMAVKAAPVPSIMGYPYNANGFYFGVGALGDAASSTVGGAGVFTAGAAVDVVGGYQWKGGLDFIALEARASYTNLGSSTACPDAGGASCSIGTQWGLEQRAKFGFPITLITNALPSLGGLFPAVPMLPTTITTAVNSTAHPYISVGITEDDVSANIGLPSGREWQVQPTVGAGVMTQWTQGLVADVFAECSFAGTGFTFGPIPGNSANLGRKCTTGLHLIY